MTERELATYTNGNTMVQSNRKWWTLIVVSVATFMLLMDAEALLPRLAGMGSAS